ncbi:MAG: glucose-6-phosphate isomerase [Fermentimonas sp.]|jgi:glucose-6-phosphate isomerase|nr:glucose-6-phosphate isomerase [Fermentimonas sp.]NLC86530.1 glucose-6-phosphate isomerase [Bacteroidales bacterium]HBT85142.1 glucose-6-phosphate isomerase [Porphyromonadaceae bacterium]MDD2930545.1 glucose-6-phosphate isomerase [Fermentimonas sp.]MDD3188218.1 glucose-6-phosphate isomerase [Fermentimonas sp.]
MDSIQLNIKHLAGIVSEEEILRKSELATSANRALHDGSREGSDFLGWVNLPSSITEEEIRDIEDAATVLRTHCEVVVIVGIGGSYLGARAVIDALSNSFDWLQEKDKRKNPVVLFAGNNISEDYLSEMVDYLDDKEFGIINISKSGTTTEPALAFRLLKNLLEKKVGTEESKNRIIAITDAVKGALRTLADSEGYKTFIIPDNIGGRYSVLTPVGLLPIAVAGINIRKLVAGAAEIEQATGTSVSFDFNLPAIYAVIRNELYKRGKKIEILVNYHPKLHYFAEWWKQLFGESEGKDQMGIFPAAVDFTADLHSMGQWIQEGERTIFETVISIREPNEKIHVPHDDVNLDGLNYLKGKRVDEVNKMAELGTRLAHVDGGVPNILIEIPELNEKFIGQLIYFFEKACGISGYLLGVNPFNQPGVEAYKKNMFALLEKPGYEEATKAIKSRL